MFLSLRSSSLLRTSFQATPEPLMPAPTKKKLTRKALQLKHTHLNYYLKAKREKKNKTENAAFWRGYPNPQRYLQPYVYSFS